MIRQFGILAIMVLSAGAAGGETVTGSEFFEDRNGYPCFTTLNTDADKSVTLQLSDYKDVWSLKFVVSDRASTYRQYFNSRGLLDGSAFENAFAEVRIGDRAFSFNDKWLFEIQRQDVDDKTAGIFSLDEQHNVVPALEAMASEGIQIKGLVSLDGTADPLSEFRSCSYAAMGLQEGERVKTDFRAEYRIIFEGALENWVASMARAEHCLAARFDDDAVSEVIEAAADAFYPGILNFGKRSEYRKDLEGILPMAKLSGMADSRTTGCLMAGRLANLSRMPVDKAIEEAANLD